MPPIFMRTYFPDAVPARSPTFARLYVDTFRQTKIPFVALYRRTARTASCVSISMLRIKFAPCNLTPLAQGCLVWVPYVVRVCGFYSRHSFTIPPPRCVLGVVHHLHLDHRVLDDEQQGGVDLADEGEVLEHHDGHEHQLITVRVLV